LGNDMLKKILLHLENMHIIIVACNYVKFCVIYDVHISQRRICKKKL